MNYGMFEGKRIDNGEIVQGMLIEYGGCAFIQTMLGTIKKNEGEFDYRFGDMTIMSCAYEVEPASVVQTQELSEFVNNYECGFESRLHDVTDDDKEGFIFVENEDGTYCVSGYYDEGDIPNELVIPREHKGKPVTSIGYRAFFEYENITSVVLHNGIVSIDKEAFKHSGLKGNVVLPESVKHVGDEAFLCHFLDTITISNNSTYFGKNVSNIFCQIIYAEPKENVPSFVRGELISRSALLKEIKEHFQCNPESLNEDCKLVWNIIVNESLEDGDFIERNKLLDIVLDQFGCDLAYYGSDLQFMQEAIQFIPGVSADLVDDLLADAAERSAETGNKMSGKEDFVME